MNRPCRPALLHVPALAGALVLGACSSSDPGTTPDEPVEPEAETTEALLDPPASGFLIESIGTNIRAGEDVEYCEVARFPGSPDETYYVNRMEVAFNEFSHHLILYTVPPGSEAESQYEVGDIVPCNGAHQFGTVGALTGSQKPYQNIQYPDGIGRTVQGGQMIIWNYHHLNTSKDDVWGRHAVAMHTVDKSEIVQLAKTFAMANVAIDVPPRSEASFTSECTFDQDIQVWALSRHTHQWGTNFDVSFVGDRLGDEHLWTSTDYEADTSFQFERDYGLDSPTIRMRAGEGFRFTCHYDNPTDEPLRFGFEATDEMCILFGAWWDVTPDADTPGQSCVIQSIDADGIGRGERFDAPGFE